MKTCDVVRLNLRFCGLLVALSGLLPGCGSTSKEPAVESQPTSPSDDTSSTGDDATPSADSSPGASGSASQRDAAPATTRRDAGAGTASATDAATARVADAATVLDAAATDSARDATVPSGIDAAMPSHDAATPTPTVDAQVDATTAHADATTAQVVHVDSKDEWTASAFKVQAGKCYAINTKIDDKWLDLDVPADLSGWTDKTDFRFGLFAPFRRVVQDDIGFYQFATCVDKKLDQCFPVGASSTVCPKTAGELFFFCNDVPGAESNNVGTATVTIQAK